jgi:hypothetical protein
MGEDLSVSPYIHWRSELPLGMGFKKVSSPALDFHSPVKKVLK